MFTVEKIKKISKVDYKTQKDELMLKVGELQRKAKELKVPILIIFEGMQGTGKGLIINELLLSLDPRGYNLYNNPDDRKNLTERPMFWKFWEHLPKTGEISIFYRSWYFSTLWREKDYNRSCIDINNIEEFLQDSGMVVLKFFLYTSKNEQSKRLKRFEKNPLSSKKSRRIALRKNKHYDEIMDKWEKIIQISDNGIVDWHIVCAEDLNFAKLEVLKLISQELENRLEVKTSQIPIVLPTIQSFDLSTVDLKQNIKPKEYKETLKKYQKRLHDLQFEVFKKKIPVIIAYEGWDAAGKGGNIKRLVEKLDPRGYSVIPISSPNDFEKSRPYLWRFWHYFPKFGYFAIFDRTWYGRVLVERVENFATELEWKRSYKEIREMEEQWVNSNAVVIKFWLQIDKDEQLRRFEERKNNQDKQWKITDEDWRNREKWDEYELAVSEMIARTNNIRAPWTIVPSNNKYYSRLFVLKTVIEAIEDHLKK